MKLKFELTSLELGFKKENVTILFSAVSYFWGQMGAGKTSIAKLIDFCLGGDIELSPAMQSEFATATLTVQLARSTLAIERQRASDRVVASWNLGKEKFQIVLPTRKAEGEVIPSTDVETLSDLIFWLSDIEPPKVRKSKQKSDSDLGRLSIRDLLWYCYLDQDEIDSSFFHLQNNAHTFKRLKSRDVIRYIIGFHDEKVAALEANLDQLRGERLAIANAIESLRRALLEVGVESELQIVTNVNELRVRADYLERQINIEREQPVSVEQTSHAVDELRSTAIRLGDELAKIDEAIRDIVSSIAKDTRHLHELETLNIKYQRSISARAVLAGVLFEHCPKCAQKLPKRKEFHCSVCDQEEQDEFFDDDETAIIKQDIQARMAELKEMIGRHDSSLSEAMRKRHSTQQRKNRVELERNEASRAYDSALLSRILLKERERASLLQEAANLEEMVRLPQLLAAEYERAGKIQGKETRLRAELKEARKQAESDDTNLDKLKDYFLDCLVRSKVPGIARNDLVEIPTTTFFPEILGPSGITTTTFETLSSGGKKTLFKCCFAIAIHRLAAQLRAPLPQFLMIDSPMKNISERENKEAFESFYKMIYELKDGELSKTQIILIDKEYSKPKDKRSFDILERHMRPSDPKNPPLIPYYKGK